MTRPGTLPILVAALAAGALIPSPAHAACLVRAQAGAALQELSAGVASADDSTDFGSSSTSASFGQLFASSNVSLSNTQTDGGSNPIPIAHFEDDWTVTIPSQPGLVAGALTFEVLLVGEPTIEVQVGGAGAIHEMNTSYQLLVSRNGGSVASVSGGRLYGTGMTPELVTLGTVPAPGLVSIDVPVVFGSPMNLAFDLISSTGGRQVLFAGQQGFTIGRTGMGLYWAGVSSVRDNLGNELLSQAAVSSCSGVDWLVSQEPPPVPFGPAVGLGVGLGAIGIGLLSIRGRAAVIGSARAPGAVDPLTRPGENARHARAEIRDPFGPERPAS